jgi:hypothetical protein
VRPKAASRWTSTATRWTFPSCPPATGDYDCLEGPPMGTQFGQGQQELPATGALVRSVGSDGQSTKRARRPSPSLPGDYLVEVVIPEDPHSAGRCTR